MIHDRSLQIPRTVTPSSNTCIRSCLGKSVRDRSLITGRGGLQNGKLFNFLQPPPPPPRPPQDMIKLVAIPPFSRVETFCVPPPFNMAKTSGYYIQTTPRLVVPPRSAWLQLFLPPSPFGGGKTSYASPSGFVATPPPTPLPVNNDQSLIGVGDVNIEHPQTRNWWVIDH